MYLGEVSILVVDELELVRRGIVEQIDAQRGLRVCAQAESFEAAQGLCQRELPDVVVLDINMAGTAGIDATRRLLSRFPSLRIVAMSIYDHNPFPKAALEAGARGYVLRGGSTETLIDAIRAVAGGDTYVAAQVACNMVISGHGGGGTSPVENLTGRELQIIGKVAEGLGLAEIAESLHLGYKTVCTYRYRLFEKLGVRNDVELTLLAMRHRLIPAPV